MKHLLANLWLLLLSLILCSVAYPLALLALAQLPFLKGKSEGSLLTDKDGKVIGSRLEAQAFEGDEYFWPRPSSGSYNGASSGGSNLSANNPALRQRVENQLGTVLKYGPKGASPGKMIGPDIEKWFTGKKGIVAEWANDNSSLAEAWVKNNDLIGEFIKNEKARKLDDDVQAWIKETNEKELKEGRKEKTLADFKTEELAVPFLRWFSKNHSGVWPTVEQIDLVHKETGEKAKGLKLKPVTEGRDIRGFFYPLWRREHPDADLDPVPADMVTTSGSGLDPHITMKSALYQFDRVADKWAELRNLPRADVARRLHKLLDGHKHAPLFGIAGVDLINVMDVNLALKNGAW